MILTVNAEAFIGNSQSKLLIVRTARNGYLGAFRGVLGRIFDQVSNYLCDVGTVNLCIRQIMRYLDGQVMFQGQAVQSVFYRGNDINKAMTFLLNL